jgi:hypothetical protein
VSRSGSLAQCCSGSACTFWSSCSAGTLFASQTSLFCDQGYCNTAVLVPSIGASSGQNYLGCWATSLGQNPFTVIADIGSGQSYRSQPRFLLADHVQLQLVTRRVPYLQAAAHRLRAAPRACLLLLLLLLLQRLQLGSQHSQHSQPVIPLNPLVPLTPLTPLPSSHSLVCSVWLR